MSSENVELAHRAADAFNRRDLDALLAFVDPALEYLDVLRRHCPCSISR